MNEKNNRIIIYTILMVIFAVLSYVFIDSGVSLKNKIYVNYQENSDVNYKVYLKKNNIYDKEYLGMKDKYISELVDYIDFNIDYKSIYSDDVNGYYSYSGIIKLVTYEEDINDTLFEKEYTVLEDKINVLDKNNITNIDIIENIKIDYDKYKKELNTFIDDYNIDVNGYLLLELKINKMLDFSSLEKDINEESNIQILIPLTNDIFKIKVLNDDNNINSYYDFTKKNIVNYILVLIGIICLSISITFLVMIIKDMIVVINRESKYCKKLKKIFDEHDDKIVEVKRFYNKKKYNLIYVDSFDELIDVYNKVGNPISFKEVKKNYEAIFLIIDEDNAWIYRMNSENEK